MISKVHRVSLNRLKNMLEARAKRGAFIVSMVATVDPRMVVKHRETNAPNPYLGAMRRSHINGVLNWGYEDAVNNQRRREGQPLDDNGAIQHFTAMPRQWGRRVPKTPFVVHTCKGEDKQKTYVEIKIQRVMATEYVMPDGSVVDPEAIRPYLPLDKGPGRQGVVRKIILRDYELVNINVLECDKKQYVVAA